MVVDPIYGHTEIHIGNPRYFAAFEDNTRLEEMTAIVNELEGGRTDEHHRGPDGRGKGSRYLGIISLADAPDDPQPSWPN